MLHSNIHAEVYIVQNTLDLKGLVDIFQNGRSIFQVKGTVCAKTEGMKGPLGETRQSLYCHSSLLRRNDKK